MRHAVLRQGTEQRGSVCLTVRLPEVTSGLRVWSGVVGVVCVVDGGGGADGRGPTSSTV